MHQKMLQLIQEKLEEMRKPGQNSASVRKFLTVTQSLKERWKPTKPILLKRRTCSKLVTMK